MHVLLFDGGFAQEDLHVSDLFAAVRERVDKPEEDRWHSLMLLTASGAPANEE